MASSEAASLTLGWLADRRALERGRFVDDTAGMRCALVLALGLAACGFDPRGRLVADDVEPPIDAAAIDVPELDAFVCTCALGCRGDNSCADYQPSNSGDFPLLAGPTAPLSLPDGNYVFDSDARVITGPSGPVSLTGIVSQTLDNMWVIGVASFTLPAGANVRGLGARAIKILSKGPVDIAGVIDVSGGCTDGAVWCGGPGGGSGGHPTGATNLTPATGCAIGSPGVAGAGVSESGGGGGGFGTPGGAGGAGTDIPATSGGAAGGACGSAVALVPLTGGSGGGAAGYVFASTDGRVSGGGGGGALQISALGKISVTGVLRAAGAGGRGTPAGDDGGGGGGAGGGILLEAPTIELSGTARLVANGGGGGAGFTAPNRNGERGRDDRVRAAGGANDDGTHGGVGAIGATTGEDATAGDAHGDGGAGGGGGAGSIRLNSFTPAIVGALVSPAPSLGSITPR